MEQNTFKKNIMRYAFGWNHKAWQYVFKQGSFLSNKKFIRILEIGASRYSICGIIFDGLAEEIVIGYYQDSERELIENYLFKVKQKIELKSKYKLEKIDAHTVTGSFDLVIMKSVLGGLFRKNETSIGDVESFLYSLMQRALNDNGSLITIDNGKSLLESLLSKFGARKNQWRFFSKAELTNASKQFEFGLLSSFSFETRWGIFGHLLDNYIVYPLDLVLFKIFPDNPTVILRIFSRP